MKGRPNIRRRCNYLSQNTSRSEVPGTSGLDEVHEIERLTIWTGALRATYFKPVSAISARQARRAVGKCCFGGLSARDARKSCVAHIHSRCQRKSRYYCTTSIQRRKNQEKAVAFPRNTLTFRFYMYHEFMPEEFTSLLTKQCRGPHRGRKLVRHTSSQRAQLHPVALEP